jgi:hypothetical protein
VARATPSVQRKPWKRAQCHELGTTPETDLPASSDAVACLVEVNIGKPAPATGSISAAADRMRRHRQRKREGLRLIHVLLRDSEINALIYHGLLDERTRNDATAITQALHDFFDRTLGRTRRSSARPW